LISSIHPSPLELRHYLTLTRIREERDRERREREREKEIGERE